MKNYISIMTLMLVAVFFSACTQPAQTETIEPTSQTQTENTPEPMASSVEDDSAILTLEDGLYIADGEESLLYWKGSKITGSSHEGTVDINMGDIEVVDNKIQNGMFVIDMTTIDTTDLEGDSKQNMDDHLKNEDFFNVEAHPEANFMVLSGESREENTWNIVGDLTIKGITNPIDMVVEAQKMDENVLLVGDFVIDRTLWDVRYGSDKFFDNLGDNIINDEIEFRLELVLEPVE